MNSEGKNELKSLEKQLQSERDSAERKSIKTEIKQIYATKNGRGKGT